MSQPQHVFAAIAADVTSGGASLTHQRGASTVSFSMWSTMRAPIFWRNALGVTVSEPSTSAFNEDEGFYIQIRYDFHHRVSIDTRELMEDIDPETNHVERKAIADVLTQMDQSPLSYGQRCLTYTLGISRERLERLGGVVYLNDVDLVVGFEEFKDHTPHPFTPPGMRHQLSQNMEMKEGFQHRIFIIDNTGIYGDLWVNTGEEVYKVPVYRDPAAVQGIHLTVKRDGKKIESKSFNFEEGCKLLCLFPSYHEAESFGHPELQFKKKIKQAENELTERKMEMLSAKADYEERVGEVERMRRELDTEISVKKAAIERERDLLKNEKDILDGRRQAFLEDQKFQHETKGRDRKDQSEQWKHILDTSKTVLSIVATILSVYALAQKSK